MPPKGASRKLVHWNLIEKINWFCFTLIGFLLIFDELCLTCRLEFFSDILIFLLGLLFRFLCEFSFCILLLLSLLGLWLGFCFYLYFIWIFWFDV